MRLISSILVLAMASQGCTFIGLGIGLQSPETETVDSRGVLLVEPGTEMEIVVETDIGKTTTIRGRFVAATEDIVALEVPEGRFTVNRRWIRRVTINTGTQWVKGLITGTVIDAGVLLVALLLSSGNRNRFFR